MPIKIKTQTKPKKVAAKKAVKKTVVKKTTKTTPKKSLAKTKKSTPKKDTARKMPVATGADCFWTHDGQILPDLVALKDALHKMSKTVYQHHVTKEKNDFADWVQYVLEDMSCAEELRKRKTPSTARLVVITHLKSYRI